MIDIITYCTNTDSLVIELESKFPALINVEDSENPSFLVDKTPTVRNGAKTMSLLRVNESRVADLETLENLEILGTFEEVFEDSVKKEIYDSVYICEYTYKDEDGNEQTGMRPEQFGGFA